MHVLIALLTLLLSPQQTSGAVRTIAIGVDDTMKYSVSAIEAAPGETVRIVITSTGSMPRLAMAHNLVLLQRGTNAAAFVKAGAQDRATDFIAPAQKSKVVAATPMVGAGETGEVTFTVPERKGKYEFVCTFPGHFALGMKGTLTVR